MKIKLLFLLLLAILYGTGCHQTPANKKNVPAPVNNETKVAPAAEKIPDFNRLIGVYLRSDGVYKLSIISATADGKLDAAYFNPEPVHVGKAEWIFKNDFFYIRVELRDVNYPGSTYTLKYFPADGQLEGNYYQAVEKQNYDVLFKRQK